MLLDQFSLKDIRLWTQRHNFLMDYYWEHYSYFAHRRSLIMASLKEALLSSCQPFAFKDWQRVIDYQFSMRPLSTKGSILNSPGGRFNIGNIDQTKFPTFGALYLAENREIAYKEKYDLYPATSSSGLTADELTLTSRESTTIIAVAGEINCLIINAQNLKKFYDLIKEIKLSRHLMQSAKRLNIPLMHHVKNLKQLIKTILEPNWKQLPMIFGIPSNSQILGQICFTAGIEGILYPSKINNEKNCLAIFPNNFINSNSFVEIQGKFPIDLKPVYKRLDSKNLDSML